MGISSDSESESDYYLDSDEVENEPESREKEPLTRKKWDSAMVRLNFFVSIKRASLANTRLVETRYKVTGDRTNLHKHFNKCLLELKQNRVCVF